MPLPKQVLPIQLGPLDTKTDPKVAPAGTLTVVENFLMTAPGRYDKRPGFSNAGLAAVGAPATVLGTLEGQLVQAAAGRLYVAQQAPTPSWHDSGACPVVEVNGSIVYASQGDQTCADVCYSGGLLVYVYENNETFVTGGLRYTVVDRATGTHVLTHALLPGTSGLTRPKVVAYGGYAYVFSCNSTRLKVQRFSLSTPATVTSPVDATGGVTLADWPYEISVQGSVAFIGVAGLSTKVGVARYDLAANAQINAGAFDSFTPAPVPSTGSTANICELAHDYADGKIWWAYVHIDTPSANLRVLVLSQDIASPATFTQLANVAQSATPGSAVFSVGDLPRQICGYVDPVTGDKVVYIETSVSKQVAKFSVAAGQIQSTSWVANSGTGILSRAFRSGSYAYWRMVHALTGSVQPTAFLMRSDGAIVARSYPGSAGGLITRQGCASSTPSVGSGVFAMATGRRTAVLAQGTTFTGPTSLGCVEYTPGSVAGPPVVAGGNIFIPGGVVQQFDTSRATELGFHLLPEPLTGLTDAGVAGTLTAGTYWYQFVWEWYDNTGKRHQSSPSFARSVTVAANRQVLISYNSQHSLLWTTKPAGAVFLVAYRTVVNAPQSATYYRTSTKISSPWTGSTIQDNLPDTTLTANEPLYTEGDTILENLAPPPSNVLHVWGNRLWAVNAEDPVEIWPSKEIREGVGIAFNDALKMRADDAEGGFRALSDLEDKLLAFKKRAIYVLTGEGPDDAGNGAWGRLERMSGAIGCSTPKGVLKVPQGLMFPASDGLGIYRLGSDGGLAYAGAPIETLNAETIVGSVYVPGRRLACWVTSTGKVLAYDTVIERWYVWPTGITCTGAALYNGELALFGSTGIVYVQTPATWTDNGTAVASAVETTWISAAGIGGRCRFWRVQLVGAYYGAHTVTVTMSFNFGNTTKTVTKAVNLTVLADGSYRAEAPVPLAMQSATAMKVRVSDSFPLGATQGGGLTALGLLVGLQPGRARVPAARVLT